MAGHLASATVRVFLLAQEAKELVAGGLAEEQGHTRVAVVGIQEIVAGAQVIGGADLGGLLALAGDNERSLALAVEDPGQLIDPPREQHIVMNLALVVSVKTQGFVAGSRITDRYR